MTVVAIAGRRLSTATAFSALSLVITGLVLGFVLARFVPSGGLNESAAGLAGTVAVGLPGHFGGLSPDDRQVLRHGAVVGLVTAPAQFGGLSPDDRQFLSDGSGHGSAATTAISGGLSPDERDEVRDTR